MNKRIILTASFFGFIAVLLGAFGAHALKALVDGPSLEIWQKGVNYQFYHTFAMLYLSTFARYRNKLINIAYFCFTFGIILFSGSLYLLATRNILQLDFVNLIGPLTPIGGLLFVLGWIMLFFAAIKDK
ncbi:uncharacterized membrane protein YgdD (TMEM256/DUF423 family) [Pedobacter psychrotolerans]|uniref:Membrane protein n=1 Tax=Pedobacter psychrotolerans TaxID=1843235 RepID=A0A4R2HCU1_9SPHI|nr:DUF423 domain-containing protein [Pedobacter psychrotolerans]TCO25182.1 uncharacterized membrane protein YgdD (TMEM256/DUF423 family) [Pedobacter psychrotolerans]GGE47475.1 membrane protein [Pedobacter psychrotolerans]